MNTSKIIKGVVGGGKYTVTAPIVKEDYGLYLKIEGVELPETYQVDFSNSENNGTSVTMIGNSDGVLIPRQFIETGKDVFAFLYHVGADFGRTIYKFRIPNKVRPDRTNEEPTPEEQSVIDQAISALNEAVEQTSRDVVSADQSAQSASDDADRAEDARDTAQDYAEQAEAASTNASTYALNAGDKAVEASQSAQSAEQSAQTASEKADSITGLTAQATTLPDGSSATANYNAETGVMSFGIPRGKDGTNGDDGYSPTASVTKSGKVATITITDKTGTTSAQVEDGTDGTDGVSPTVSITPITGGHRITITDADGEHSADVMDGDDYTLTAQDKQDIAELVDVPVNDVQINGSSIVTDGVANVPVASTSAPGVVKINSNTGHDMDGTTLRIYRAMAGDIKAGTQAYRPITPSLQQNSVFYGLAKSAGDTTQSASSNAVGTYTEDAKIAIQKMLGIYEPPWELIEDFTLEEVGTIDKVTEPDGTPYNFLQVFIKITIPPNSETPSSGYGLYYFYDENNQNILAETGRYAQDTAQMFKHVFFQKSKNMAMVTFTRSTSIGTYAILYNKHQGVGVEFGNVRRVRSVGPEPAGTQFQIYAQRAY